MGLYQLVGSEMYEFGGRSVGPFINSAAGAFALPGVGSHRLASSAAEGNYKFLISLTLSRKNSVDILHELLLPCPMLGGNEFVNQALSSPSRAYIRAVIPATAARLHLRLHQLLGRRRWP